MLYIKFANFDHFPEMKRHASTSLLRVIKKPSLSSISIKNSLRQVLTFDEMQNFPPAI